MAAMVEKGQEIPGDAKEKMSRKNYHSLKTELIEEQAKREGKQCVQKSSMIQTGSGLKSNPYYREQGRRNGVKERTAPDRGPPLEPPVIEDKITEKYGRDPYFVGVGCDPY